MENASKALLMAAGVLIGVLILSLAVFLFINFGQQAEQIHGEITANQLTQFNAQFNVYEGRNDITIHQIVTLVNLAKENNKNYNVKSSNEENYIDITIGNISVITNSHYHSGDGIRLITEIGFKKRYKCNKVDYYENGRVKCVNFIYFNEID